MSKLLLVPAAVVVVWFFTPTAQVVWDRIKNGPSS